MEHSVFTIFAVVIVLLLRLAKNAGNSAAPPASRPQSPRGDPASTESEEARMRRFMDAVGLPPGATPPPPVRPRAGTNPGPLPTISPPVLIPTAPGRLRRVPFPPGGTVVPRSAGSYQQPAPIRRVLPASYPSPAPAPVSSVAPQQPPAPAITGGYEEAAPGVPAIGRAAVAADAKPSGIPASALMTRLRDPAAIREAIILREVLGPPKALRPPGQLGLVFDLPPLAA